MLQFVFSPLSVANSPNGPLKRIITMLQCCFGVSFGVKCRKLHSVMPKVWLTTFFLFILLCYHFLVEMLHQINTEMLTTVLVFLLYRNRDTKLEERGISSGSKTPAGEESGR